MDKAIFEILVCPSCNGKLKMSQEGDVLVCSFDKLAFRINDGIPNMLIDAAQKLSDEDIQSMRFR
ncbi:Trm112 family protein [Pleionea sediminis]|uniref:Trm112 family protein n=1 Tax=Pleionea sediminis TaxID=2569479 RepID=UPI00197B5D2B|nr:Trm112 family protein [Pleionea sediminis]